MAARNLSKAVGFPCQEKLLRKLLAAGRVCVRGALAIPISAMMPWRTLSTPRFGPLRTRYHQLKPGDLTVMCEGPTWVFARDWPTQAVSCAAMELPSSQMFSRDMPPSLNSQTWSMRKETVLPSPAMPRNSPVMLAVHWCSITQSPRRTRRG